MCPPQAWDALRTKHSGALDDILEQLGSQRVPSDFYQTTSPDSSLFGSQRSDEGSDKQTGGPPASLVSHSPSSTLRQGLLKGKPAEKEKSESEPKPTSSWKTLRDFVDDQAIEDVLENIENDRLALDVCSLAPMNSLSVISINLSSRISRGGQTYTQRPSLILWNL